MHNVEEKPLVLIKALVYHHNWWSYKSFEPLTLVCTDKHCTVSSFICSHKDLEKATTNSSQFDCQFDKFQLFFLNASVTKNLVTSEILL